MVKEAGRMNVNGKLTIIAVLVAALGASNQAQTRTEAHDRTPEYRVSPYLVFDDARTNTVRGDAATVQNGAPAAISLNNGTGQFALAGGPDGEAINAVLADVSGDGTPDLAIARRTGVSLLLAGDGRGGFGLATPLAGTESGATGIAAADVDADGDTDFAIARGDGQDCLILLNDGQGQFMPRPVDGSAGSYAQILLEDVTGDARIDLALYAFDGDNPLFTGDGTGQFRRTGNLDAPDQPVDVAGRPDPFADPTLPNPGQYDLPFRILVTPALDGGTEFTPGIVLDDSNGDGLPDLIFRNPAE
jgi:hypothetical protein